MAHSRQAPWKAALVPHQTPLLRRSIWQLVNSVVPYLALWALMAWSTSVSYWLTLALAVPAAGFLVRIFIIFHDCGHGSFFRSRRANDFWGRVTGVLTFTPYQDWRRAHAVHHATAGDLDRRGIGDVWTMTVTEYLAASRGKRVAYRLTRSPLVLFLLAPLYLFLIGERFPTKGAGPRERHSVYLMNATLLALVVGMSLTLGLKRFVMVQFPLTVLASMAGIWLFYVQHQFDGVAWERGDRWDFVGAALQGSSFYRLPRVLQWFSGNIGFHHIHHLSPAIPNYNLERCHRAVPLFQTVRAVTLWTSLKALSYRLWDEQRRRLVGYREARMARREARRDARSISGSLAPPA